MIWPSVVSLFFMLRAKIPKAVFSFILWWTPVAITVGIVVAYHCIEIRSLLFVELLAVVAIAWAPLIIFKQVAYAFNEDDYGVVFGNVDVAQIKLSNEDAMSIFADLPFGVYTFTFDDIVRVKNDNAISQFL
jgi:hypothetical protein